MRNSLANWKWAMSLVISLTLLAVTAFAYLNNNFVNKDSFHLICERLTVIDAKLDKIIEKHIP